MKLKRLFRNLIAGAIIAILLLPSIAVLAIDPPNAPTPTIDAVWAYRHCLENGDRLFIISYVIDYTTPNPPENVTEAYIARFMTGTTELKGVAPYAYYNDGYGRGVVMIYFTANEATTLPVTWEGAYKVKLVGNPTLSWSAAIPETTCNTFNSWSASASIAGTQQEISARVLYLAGQLQSDWGYIMIEPSGAGSKLSTYGENYFSNLVTGMRDMAPYAYSGQTIEVEFVTKERDPVYAVDLAATTAGTPLDLSGAAASWGTSEMFLKSLIWIGLTVGVLVISAKYMGTKPSMLLSLPMIAGGALLGMLPLVLAIMVGVLAFLLTGYTLFYSKSGA